MDRRRGFAWPFFLIHRLTHSHGTFLFIIREGEREGEGFPWNLGKVTSVLFRTIPPLRVEFTLPLLRQGGKRHSLEQCSPKCPCSSPASSIFFLRERDTAEDNKCIRIPNFSYTEFHPLDIPHHSLGNLGSRGERAYFTSGYIRYFFSLEIFQVTLNLDI